MPPIFAQHENERLEKQLFVFYNKKENITIILRVSWLFSASSIACHAARIGPRSEGLQKTLAPPPGLLMKLTYTMDHTLRAAAAHKATQALSEVLPMPSWEPEVTPPQPPADELIKALQTAVDRNETVDVLYQASSKHSPEYRHLTPLLVESRGARYYLVAYCHTRRANRTFRLDRLKLCGL